LNVSDITVFRVANDILDSVPESVVFASLNPLCYGVGGDLLGFVYCDELPRFAIIHLQFIECYRSTPCIGIRVFEFDSDSRCGCLGQDYGRCWRGLGGNAC